MHTNRRPTTTAWLACAVVALGGLAAVLWPAPPAEAQLGGQAQVTRLELRYTPDAAALDARFHLASGLAVTQRIEDGQEIDRLLRAVEIHAGGRARMFVTVESDRVRSWQLSVP